MKFDLELISRREHPPQKSDFGCLLAPFLVVYNLLFFLFIVIVGKAYEFIRYLNPKTRGIDKEELRAFHEKKSEESAWLPQIHLDALTIYTQYVGEIRFNGAHVRMKSEPRIENLEKKLYGEWFFITETGCFVQQWNDVYRADTNLLFVDKYTLLVTDIMSHIPSANWEMTKMDENVFQLSYVTMAATYTYLVTIKAKSQTGQDPQTLLF